jgi:hypothetical protein
MAEQVNSILAADFGSVQTRVVLFDIVDGEYRLVAQGNGNTTVGYPVDDVSVGLRLVVEDMETFTGRRLLDKQGRVITPEDNNRRGVDAFVATASAGRPLRAVIIGLMPDISLMTALRAISGAYIEPVAALHLRDGMSEEERLNAILLGRPDVIFIAGGTNGGAQSPLMEILATVKLALTVMNRDLRPTVLYAGNDALAADIRALLEDHAAVMVAKNVRPDMKRESFNSVLLELGRVYDRHRETNGAGFARVGLMSETGVLPTAQSYNLVAQYFARADGGNVMTVDVGSTSAVMVGVFRGRASTNINTARGLGHSALAMLDELGEAAIERWLPYHAAPSEIRNYALNKTARPFIVPMTLREFYMEYAFLRAGLQDMLVEARELWVDVEDTGMMPPVKTLIAGGSALTNTGNPALAMMLIADCMQPSGITEVKADKLGLVPTMGALARLNPTAVVQILDSNTLEHLGTLVSIDGRPQEGELVARLQILMADEDDPIEADLKGGHIITVPASREFTLRIKIRMQSGYTIGGRRRLTLELHGGTAGIVFDARGRLLVPPETVDERAVILTRWVEEAADIHHEIPDEWLIKPAMPTPPPATISLDDLPADAASVASADDDIDIPAGNSDFDPFADLALDDDDLFADDDDPTDKDQDEIDSLRGLMN